MDDSYNLDQIFTNFLENNKDKQLKMVIGAGNKNYGNMKDYDKFNNEYDITISNLSNVIDKNITSPISLYLDINKTNNLELLSKLLEGRFIKIIIDYSTNKFLNWNDQTFKYFYKLLAQNGKLYIDSTVYQYMILNNDDFNNEYIKMHYDFCFVNNSVYMILKKDKFYTVPIKTNSDLIQYTNNYIYPSYKDILYHNSQVLNNVGFTTNITLDNYPLTSKSIYNNKIIYIEATKFT